MTWKPLLERLDGDANNLPLILAGPILRKVTKDSVTVWFVLREKKTATLNIYDNSQKFIPSSQSTNCTTIGKHVHIYTLTANFATPLNDENWKHYYYDLDVYNDGYENHKQLSELNLSLSYENDSNRPSFLLPQVIEHLNIIHGSCRKPHADGRDALEGLDTLMTDATFNGRLNSIARPDLLFLTGDQIYADDVADAMLYMIQDAAKVLFGWEENMRGSLEMRVGRRQKNKEVTGITSGAAKSHVYTFQEYCVLYLMVWSDVLWQDDGELPTYELLYPVLLNNKLNTPFYRQGYKRTDTNAFEATENLKTAYDKEIKNLKTFRKTLSPIRKALANIPTYMIFDDHDITDDWNLNWQWCREIYSKPMGLQILRNALSAYALFQGIGNTPEQFENGNGKAFLDEINNLTASPPTSLDGYLNIRPISLKAPIAEEQPRDPQSLIWNFQLSFEEFEIIVLDTRTMREYPEHSPFGFCGLINKAGFDIQLPEENSIEDKKVFVVSPSPLIETPIMELIKNLNPSLSPSTGKTFWDTEGWGLNDGVFQRVLSRLSRLKKPIDNTRNNNLIILSGDVHHGYTAILELWADRLFEEPSNNNITTHTTFIQFTSSPIKNQDHITRVVHDFGYKIPLASTIPFNIVPIMYNLVIAGVTYLFKASNPLPEPADTFGWNGKENGKLHIGTANPNLRDGALTLVELEYPEDPVIISRKTAENLNVPDLYTPEWVYQKRYLMATYSDPIKSANRIEFIEVLRNPDPKKIEVGDLSEATKKAIYKDLKGEFRRYSNFAGNGKEIVGVNNIGVVSFSGSRPIHSLWWHLGDEHGSPLEIYPLSSFIVILNDESPKPTYP